MIREFPALVRVGVAEMVAYRAEVFIWFLTATMPIISLLVWDNAAADGPLGRMGQAELGRYFTAVLIVRQLTGSWVVWELNEEIRDGSLSGYLLKPTHPLAYKVAHNIAAQPLRLVVLVPMVLLLLWWRPEMASLPPLPLLALGVLSTALAWALNFGIQAIFGCLAFWLRQSYGLYSVWFGVWAVFSGYLFPLEMAPPWAQDLLMWLPFRYLLATPSEMLAGLTTLDTALWELGAQCLWLVLVLALLAALWDRGVRHYEAVGG